MVEENRLILNHKNEHLIVRKAESSDIDELIEISRQGFPEAVRWQIPRFLSRKRWAEILESEIAETWICSLNGRIAGYVILLKDNTVSIVKKYHYDRYVLRKCYYHLLCPRLIFKKLVKKIHSYKKKNVTVSPAESQKEELNNCTWIDSIAVSPEMRGKGVARKLLQICRQRTLELKKEGIKLSVETENVAARNLYRNFGFYCTCSGPDADVYAIQVTDE